MSKSNILTFISSLLRCNISNRHKQTLYFKQGQLYKIVGDQKNWYDPYYIYSDGKKFDLSSPSNISSIPVPNFGLVNVFGKYGATGMLDYVLRMKAGLCFTRVEKNLCSALLWKSTEMMLANTFCSWRAKDYIRLVTWHYQMDMPEEARKARAYLEKTIPSYDDTFDNSARSIKDSILQNCQRFGMDLVVFDHYGSGCCAKCDMMSGRVYSLSGKNAVFPKLPEYVRINGNFHKGCRCSMSAYFGDEIYYRGKKINAKKASTRPYEDRRTNREKDCYTSYLERRQSDIEKSKRTLEFYELQDLFPDAAPKTLSAYSRMKNSNSQNFLLLKEKAQSVGIEI